MESSSIMPPQELDCGLQSVRETLASICEDLARLSPRAARAIADALDQIDQAHAEFIESAESA